VPDSAAARAAGGGPRGGGGALAPTWQARGLLAGPDRRTAWVVVAAATLARPVGDLEERVAAVCARVPVAGSRLGPDGWVRGPAPQVDRTAGDPLEAAVLLRGFALDDEAPWRVVCGAGGHRVAVAAHHAAFDGLGVVALLGALAGGPVPDPAPARPPGSPAPPWPAMARLLRPASRVAPSPSPPPGDAVAVRAVAPALLGGGGGSATARLAAAAAAAGAAHTRAGGGRWLRVGVSVGVGGPRTTAGGRPVAGNVASYRRVDLAAGGDVAGAVDAALADPREPYALVGTRAARLLAPVADRFADSLLVSNVGRHDLPGVTRLDFLPVARGRSAVAVGAAGLPGGPSTVSVRARDLSPADAAALLDGIVARLGG